MNETPIQFQQRVEAALDVIKAAAALQASIFALYQVQDTGVWDLKQTVNGRLDEAFHLCYNLISLLHHEIEVAYYG